MHVPVEVAEQARAAARELGADGCVAVGGGSAIGLGKAIALEHGLPVIAVPTTYAGSEMTPVWGLTEGGAEAHRPRPAGAAGERRSTTPSSPSPCPSAMSVTSGINAIAHAVEALYAPDASPVISLMAEEGVRALTAALPAVVARPRTTSTRAAEAQYGAWLCGACLGATTMSLHHKLCHALGGTLDLPHAQTHTVVLPHALAYNQAAAPDSRCRAVPRPGRADDPARDCGTSPANSGPPVRFGISGWPKRTSRRSWSRCWPTRTPTRSRSPSPG